MSTIKKKDLKHFKLNKKEELEELVDADGAPIEGDRNAVSNSEIEVAPQQTTDDFVKQSRQPNQTYNGFPSSYRKIGESKALELIKRLIENEIDIDGNGVSDIQDLATIKPIVASKARDIVNSVKMNNLNGEEIGVMLNYILYNIDTSQIPDNFKEQLRNNL